MFSLKQLIKKISPYMRSKGFSLSKKCFYVIKNDMACCLEVDAPGGFVYVTYYIIPLYVPCENRYYTYGCRLNSLPQSNLKILAKEANDDAVWDWCKDLYYCLENLVFPLFEQMATPQKFLNFIDNKPHKKHLFFPCNDVQLFRLKMFTSLFFGEHGLLEKTIREYTYTLKKCTFFTEPIKSYYHQEIDSICLLMLKGPEAIDSYFKHVISETMRICFEQQIT